MAVWISYDCIACGNTNDINISENIEIKALQDTDFSDDAYFKDECENCGKLNTLRFSMQVMELPHHHYPMARMFKKHKKGAINAKKYRQ